MDRWKKRLAEEQKDVRKNRQTEGKTDVQTNRETDTLKDGLPYRPETALVNTSKRFSQVTGQTGYTRNEEVHRPIGFHDLQQSHQDDHLNEQHLVIHCSHLHWKD